MFPFLKKKKKDKKGKVSTKIFTYEGHAQEVDKELTSPEMVEYGKGYFMIDGQYIAPLRVATYPPRIYHGWVGEEFAWKNYWFGCAIFVTPTQEDIAIRDINRRIALLEVKLNEMKGRTDTASIEKELEYLYKWRDLLVSRRTKLFKLDTYFYIGLDDKEALEDYVEEFVKKMRGKGCHAKRIRYKVLEALRSLLPEGRNLINLPSLADTEAVASLFPFMYPSIIDTSGVVYGFDQHTYSPVIVDRFKFAGHNEIIVGDIGSGKTFFAKIEMIRWLIADPDIKIFIVDPLSGFRDLALVLGAQWIQVGKDIINPMDLFIPPDETPEQALRDKLLSLMEFFTTFFNDVLGTGLDKTESGVLRKAILKAYEDKKYKDVTVDDVIERLKEVATSDEEKRASDRLLSSMTAFKADLATFNGRTNVDIKGRVVYFDFSKVEGVEKSPLHLHAVLTWIGSRVRAEEGKKIVTIDEFHYFMAYAQIRKFIERFVRHSRHYQLGLTMISQGYEEFIRYEEGRTIIENTDIHVVFRQRMIPEEVKKILKISKFNEEYVKNAVQGKTAGYSTALLVTPKGKFHIVVKATPREVETFTAGRGV